MRYIRSLRCQQVISRAVLETLESRQLLSASVVNPVSDQAVLVNASPTVIDLTSRYSNPDISGTAIRFDTTLGNIDVALTDSTTPLTVANILNYIDNGRFTSTVFHRLVPGFVLQGGGFGAAGLDTYIKGLIAGTSPAQPTHVTQFAPVHNEFQSGVTTNVRGTIAMAKVGNDPNSATSEFFFNLADNRTNLDAQNGGFTTFGSVIDNGMTVVDAIAALGRVNLDGGAFTDLPAKPTFNASNYSSDKLVVLNSVTRLPAYTLQVNTDNQALVTPILNGNSLQLSYAAGQTGTANVNVVVTTPDGGVTTDTFQVTVDPGTTTSLTASLGVGGSKMVTYTDTDGTVTTLSLTKGSGALHFSGTSLLSTTLKGITTVTGSNLVLDTVDLTDAGLGTLGIKTGKGGDGQVAIGAINTTSGGVRSIVGSKVNLTGASTIVGDVATVLLNNVNQLTVNGSVKSLKMADSSGGITVNGLVTSGKFANIKSLTVNAAGSIVAGVIDGDLADTGTLGSAKIGAINGKFSVSGDAKSLIVAGAVNETSNLGGNIGVLKLGSLLADLSVFGFARSVAFGTVTGAGMDFGGSGSKAATAFTFGTVTDARLSTAAPVGTLKVASWTNSDNTNQDISVPAISSLVCAGNFNPGLNVQTDQPAKKISSIRIAGSVTGGSWNVKGSIGSLKIAGDLSNSIEADAIASASVTGNFSGSILLDSLFSPKAVGLGKLIVGGAMNGATVKAVTSNIGSVIAGSINNSTIFAGVSTSGMPMSMGDFSVAAKIASVTVKSTLAGAFSNSLISAQTLGAMNLGSIQTANGGTQFGVAADVIMAIRGTDSASNMAFKYAKLNNMSAPAPITDFKFALL